MDIITSEQAIEASEPIALTFNEETELRRLKSHFPFHKCVAVKLANGHVEYFCKATLAQANNYARKNRTIGVFIL